MLIKCPECQAEISDKAITCIRCGFPLNPTNSAPVVESAPKQAVATPRKHRRLPNGFGQIQKKSGNRRNPYAAYPPVTEYYENGTAKPRKAIGYYPTYNKAYTALMEYMQSPRLYDRSATTFGECYELMMKWKFRGGKFSPNTKKTYVGTYNNYLISIRNVKIRDLTTDDMQKMVDECEKGGNVQGNMINVFRAIFQYAMQNDFVTKDYAQYLVRTKDVSIENGVPFFEDELKILWDNSCDETIQVILIMIYSGFRVGELEADLEINLEENYFRGGIKTKAGKNRIVPIHSLIRPFVAPDMFNGFKAENFRYKMTKALEPLGILNATTGAKHTPHDCRHTFSWLCDKFNVDNLTKHILMGHKTRDVEDDVYGHRKIEDIRKEIEKIGMVK